MELWVSFLYLYGVGGVLFFGILFWARKKGVLNPKNAFDQKLLLAILSTFFVYMSAQGLWNYLAIVNHQDREQIIEFEGFE